MTGENANLYKDLQGSIFGVVSLNENKNNMKNITPMSDLLQNILWVDARMHEIMSGNYVWYRNNCSIFASMLKQSVSLCFLVVWATMLYR